MHELRAEDPNVFGPGGGSSRTFSMTETSFAIGLVLGPLLSGALADAFGFYYATSALGTSSQLSPGISFEAATNREPSMRVDLGVDDFMDVFHAQGTSTGA